MPPVQQQYHPNCAIDRGNGLSEQQGWLGDDKVALIDVDTENDSIVKAYYDWTEHFVKEYGIDDQRIGAARIDFWRRLPVFSVSGESLRMTLRRRLSGKDPDSILNFPVRKTIVNAFIIPGRRTSPLLKQQ